MVSYVRRCNRSQRLPPRSSFVGHVSTAEHLDVIFSGTNKNTTTPAATTNNPFLHIVTMYARMPQQGWHVSDQYDCRDDYEAIDFATGLQLKRWPI
jgi:hypothetical protein